MNFHSDRRCREENVQPYFIGLLGERYGWTPRAADFPVDLQRTYKWLPGVSVTALEILTGALWDRNPNVRSSVVVLQSIWCVTQMNKQTCSNKLVIIPHVSIEK